MSSAAHPLRTVSDRARSGFDHFVLQSTRNALMQSGAGCEVVQAEDAVPPEAEVVMFTVSSYRFRVLLLIHFNRDAATREHFASMCSVPVEEMVDERFVDAVMERGNLFCGAFNRDLAHFYPHLGMSTPCILQRHSVSHVEAVRPAFSRRYKAELGAGVAMHVTVAVCTFIDIDFPFEASAVEETETAGELEMF